MFNEINIVDDYFNKSNVDYNKSNIERINDDEFVIEAKIKRVNDEGEDIPEKCNECGSKICLFLKGEPVWLCSNKKCGKYFGTLPCTIQEGAWQDIRNGVNPKSKKLFFHISMDSKMNGKTLKPRIPSYISEKGSKSDKYKEDETTPRVCFSPSIEGCLNAIISTQKNLDIVGKNIFVYVPEKGISEYKIKTNKELIKEKLVFDATTTGEMWILEPVKLKLYGVIVVDQVKNVHEKKTVDGIPHGRFDYKWYWAVTPKYVERTLDRQVTYDEWLKQAPKENNKTIKECVTMSNYPSRFTSDETNEDITQEAMMDVGFNNLRMKIAQALGDKFKVTNVFKDMCGKEKFDISKADADILTDTKTSVESTGTGCKVMSHCIGFPPKIHFNNISLSQALNKILELFEKPGLLLEGVMFSRFRTDVFMEFDDNKPSEDTSASIEINDKMTLSLPNDFWYKSENSTSDIAKAATDEDIMAAEKELGYKLPKAYKALIKQHNGGRLNRCICPTSSKTSWANDHAEISTLFGIDKNKPSIFATKFYQDEWGYPNIGLAIGSTPTDGHTMVFLDYSKCGHDGEPSVVDVDQEDNYKTSVLANDFGEFINKLITRDEFEKKQSSEVLSSDDSLETPEIPEIPEYHKEFINSGEANKYNDFRIADEVGMTKIGRFFNIEEIPNEYKTVNENIKDIKAPDGSVVKVIPVATATADCDYSESDMKDYIVLFKYANMYQYGVLQTNPVGLFRLARNIEFLRQLYDYWSDKQENVSTIDSTKTTETTQEGCVQERMFSRFRTGVFMESDDNNEDEDLGETLKDIESSVDNDENDDVDIDSFGSDTSDQQNEYSEKDITILNHLIAGESEAINDYFDGAKDANNETLRRLYGDIGHEERFHLEQLLYAKSTLTGEKYEPRDPAVEEEYKSLLAMGMDEDTAASTAIDRLSMVGNDDGDDSDIEELEQESAIIETMLFQNEIITNICEQYSTKKIDSSVGVILEAFFQEDVFSTTNATSAERQIPNPISLLLKGIRASISGLSRMSGIIRESITKSNMKNNRKKEWIKKNGISNLFASGIELYLYSNDKIDTETPARYVDLLYRLTRQIAENSGLALTANAQHKTISNPIKFNSITDGLNIVKKTILTKTKVIVNNTNKDTLAREFFGYSEQKTNVPVKHGSSEKSVNDSNNVYNRMEVLILLTKQYCKISEEVLIQLEKKGAEPRAHEGMKIIVSKYNEFIKAIAHDLKVILKLDNGLLKLTHERDAAEQSGDKWKGPDIRVPEPNNKKTKAPHKW